MRDLRSKYGYRNDSPFRDEEFIDIYTPNGVIDMSETGMDILANGRFLPRYSGLHQFKPGIVREIPIRQQHGGEIPKYQTTGEIPDPNITEATAQENLWMKQNPDGTLSPLEDFPEITVSDVGNFNPIERAQRSDVDYSDITNTVGGAGLDLLKTAGNFGLDVAPVIGDIKGLGESALSIYNNPSLRNTLFEGGVMGLSMLPLVPRSTAKGFLDYAANLAKKAQAEEFYNIDVPNPKAFSNKRLSISSKGPKLPAGSSNSFFGKVRFQDFLDPRLSGTGIIRDHYKSMGFSDDAIKDFLTSRDVLDRAKKLDDQGFSVYNATKYTTPKNSPTAKQQIVGGNVVIDPYGNVVRASEKGVPHDIASIITTGGLETDFGGLTHRTIVPSKNSKFGTRFWGDPNFGGGIFSADPNFGTYYFGTNADLRPLSFDNLLNQQREQFGPQRELRELINEYGNFPGINPALRDRLATLEMMKRINQGARSASKFDDKMGGMFSILPGQDARRLILPGYGQHHSELNMGEILSDAWADDSRYSDEIKDALFENMSSRSDFINRLEARKIDKGGIKSTDDLMQTFEKLYPEGLSATILGLKDFEGAANLKQKDFGSLPSSLQNRLLNESHIGFNIIGDENKAFDLYGQQYRRPLFSSRMLKHGGMIPKYQDAGETTVTYGTPEYSSAWYKGVPMKSIDDYINPEVPYQMGNFPEIPITAKKDRNIMGAMGPIMGQGIIEGLDILGFPANYATNVLFKDNIDPRAALPSMLGENPYSDISMPSEFIGYQDPRGFGQHAANFAIDALADPTIAFGGSGITRKGLQKALQKGKKYKKAFDLGYDMAEIPEEVLSRTQNVNILSDPEAYRLNQIKNIIGDMYDIDISSDKFIDNLLDADLPEDFLFRVLAKSGENTPDPRIFPNMDTKSDLYKLIKSETFYDLMGDLPAEDYKKWSEGYKNLKNATNFQGSFSDWGNLSNLGYKALLKRVDNQIELLKDPNRRKKISQEISQLSKNSNKREKRALGYFSNLDDKLKNLEKVKNRLNQKIQQKDKYSSGTNTYKGYLKNQQRVLKRRLENAKNYYGEANKGKYKDIEKLYNEVTQDIKNLREGKKLSGKPVNFKDVDKNLFERSKAYQKEKNEFEKLFLDNFPEYGTGSNRISSLIENQFARAGDKAAKIKSKVHDFLVKQYGQKGPYLRKLEDWGSKMPDTVVPYISMFDGGTSRRLEALKSKKALDRYISNLPKGSSNRFIGSSSLSGDSYPLTLGMQSSLYENLGRTPKSFRERWGIGHLGFSPLNNMDILSNLHFPSNLKRDFINHALKDVRIRGRNISPAFTSKLKNPVFVQTPVAEVDIMSAKELERLKSKMSPEELSQFNKSMFRNMGKGIQKPNQMPASPDALNDPSLDDDTFDRVLLEALRRQGREEFQSRLRGVLPSRLRFGGEIPKFQFGDFNTGDQGFKAFPVSTPGTPPSNLNIADLQQALVDKGYDIDVDGIWGPQTEKAYNDAIFIGPRQESNLPTIGPEIKTSDGIRFVDRPKTSFFDKPDGTGKAYKDVLLTLSDEYGKSPAELMAYYDYIANHETFGKKNKRSVKQDEGGPGRGVTQLERGEDKGAHVAANKLYWFNDQHGIEQPKWLINFRKSKYKDVVDEGLSLDQQAALTFAHDFLVSDNNRNISYKDMSKYDNFYDKDQSKNIWLDNHWKGKRKDRQARIDSFNLHNENYLLPDRLIYKYGGKIYQRKTKSMKPKKLYGTNSNPFNMKKGGIIPKFQGLTGSSTVGDTTNAFDFQDLFNNFNSTNLAQDTFGSDATGIMTGPNNNPIGVDSSGNYVDNLNINTKSDIGNKSGNAKSGNAMSGISSALSSFSPGQMISSGIEKKGDEMLGDWANLGRSTDPRLMKGANRANKAASGLHAAGSAAMSTANPWGMLVGGILHTAGAISSGIGLKKAKKAMAYGGMDKDYMDRMTQEGEYYTPSQNIMPYSAPMNVGPSYGYAEYGGTVPYYEYDEMMDNLSGDYDDLTPDQINYLRSQGYEIEEI